LLVLSDIGGWRGRAGAEVEVAGEDVGLGWEEWEGEHCVVLLLDVCLSVDCFRVKSMHACGVSSCVAWAMGWMVCR